MPPHPLTNFQIQKCNHNEPKCNSVYSRDNLLKTKDKAYIINLDEFKSIGTHCVALHFNKNNNIIIIIIIFFKLSFHLSQNNTLTPIPLKH